MLEILDLFAWKKEEMKHLAVVCCNKITLKQISTLIKDLYDLVILELSESSLCEISWLSDFGSVFLVPDSI